MVGPSLDILGGQAVQAQRLIAGLAKSTSVKVSFLPVNPRLPGALRKLQQIRYVRTVITSVAYVVSLFRQVPRVDVVHAFSASYMSYILAPLPALIVARLFRKPSVLNYRSGEAADHLTHWRLSRWTIRQLPSVVLVPSGYLVKVFGDFGITARAIPNVVPLESLPYRRRATVRPIFLSNRNLDALYDVGCTVRAFGIIQSRHPDAKLVIAGDGSQRRQLEELVQSLQLRSVEFTGKVNSIKMAALYSECDIYLNSPYIDNMPASILEAFACGLPVVSTNAGGIPYIVEDGVTGRLVQCRDHTAMAGVVLDLLADDGTSALRLADAARNQCERLYAWNGLQAQWEQFYFELLRLQSPMH